MNGMDDLTAFLNARLDEDEATAQEAAEVYACHRDDDHGNAWTADEIGQETHWSYQVDEHIARHDPARVLREVAAKRAILAEHGSDERDPFWCRVCDPPLKELRDLDGAYPCRTIRLLAAVWSDHPDYRQEWKPDTQA